MDTENPQLILALAMIAGASAIEKHTEYNELFNFADKGIPYKEAAILLREKANLLIHEPSLADGK